LNNSAPKKFSIAAFFVGLTLAAGIPAAEIKLPDIGSPADATLSKNEEAKIGRAIMQQIRASGELVEDPQVTEYINEIGHRLAAQANIDGIHEFSFFVIDNSAINAFALPGGFIGVHTGLLEATRNEDELAGVLSHEVAHVTQRHIARSIHAAQRQSILSTAIMLGAVLAGAVGGASSDALQGAIAISQGSAAQQQINFTRNNEYEADRVGISSLAAAGFDPQGMGSFFEVLSRGTITPTERRVPEFLRTHPVSSARIAEARGRARSYAPVHTADSITYGVARTRIIVADQKTPEAAVAYFEREPYEYQSDVERYGRAIAYLQADRPVEANKIFEELANKDPEIIAYHIGLGDSLLAMDLLPESMVAFEFAKDLFPRNSSLVIHYANALMRIGNPEPAHEILLDLFNNVTPTPEQIRLITRAATAAGEDAEARYYMAEYRFMIGDLIGGIQFLRQALRIPELDEIQRIRFEARIDFVRDFMSEDQLQQLQRGRTSS
jgi:predicted Zn-dependent protease